MSVITPERRPRLAATLRETDSVTPLELFFDLIFVLALTQCTALMADDPSWAGLGRGLLILALMWWGWVGYAWLTSVVDPEEGAVRLVIFGAMAGMLVVALCIPGAFGDDAVLFACAYAVVREGQIGLFLLASRNDARLRQSVWGLAGGTTLGVSLLIVGAVIGGGAQEVLWVIALALDMAEPYFFGAEGWKLAPSHFAERHGLIMIIALGESIVAIGVGAGAVVDAGVVVAAVLGIVVAAAFWWLYFDVVARVAEHRLANAEVGREQNEIARDSYSYLHFPMVAGIVLVALGMKKTLAGVDDPLKLIPTVALLGGTAAYLLAHVAFRYRNIHTLNRQRLLVAVLALAFIPVAKDLPALVTVAILAAASVALIVYETVRFAELRERVRHQLELSGS